MTGQGPSSGWTWESVLATVLDIPIPDRGEVTGQPWLALAHDGQGAPGSHLIWTADWKTHGSSGASSIQVYLSPDLYAAGGAWDRFLNTPPQALSGAPSGQYTGLPLVPPSFQGASAVVASAANFLASAAQQFGAMYGEATSGPVVGFQGNLAGVAGELLGHLRMVTTSLYQQMTEPVRYGDSIEQAGESASTFLTDLVSAHSSWTRLAEHSPLGAVVAVLQQIAAEGPSGQVISDPRHTAYGDLTVDSSWAAIERHAKDLWTDTLTGGPSGFAGLDLLGRTALDKLTDQFSATTSAVVPVVGPARSQSQPSPVSPAAGAGPDPGHTGTALSGAGSQPGPAARPQPNAPASGPVSSFFEPVSLGGPGEGGVGIGGRAAPGDGPALPSPAGAGSLNAPAGDPPADLGQPGFSGAIGRPAADGNEGSPLRRAAIQAGSGKSVAATVHLTAPVAGFSLGRDPGGTVLQQSLVPKVAARPSGVTSSAIGAPAVQAPIGAVAAPGGPMSGSTAVGASTQVPVENGAVMTGNGGMIGTGHTRAERQRLAYLPQESRYWGTEPGLAGSLRAVPDDDDRMATEHFDAVPPRIAGIGAQQETGQQESAAKDWRML